MADKQYSDNNGVWHKDDYVAMTSFINHLMVWYNYKVTNQFIISHTIVGVVRDKFSTRCGIKAI